MEIVLMKPRAMHLCLATLIVLIASSAWEKEAYHPQAADDVPSDVASAWFDLLYDVVKTEQSAPPVAARTYGIAAVALYEAIVPGSRAHTSLVNSCTRSPPCPAPHPISRTIGPRWRTRPSPTRSAASSPAPRRTL
jgi:hypothetical protein